MNPDLNEARNLLRTDPKFAGLTVREEEGEFHLFRGDDRFARLIPTEQVDEWRMEYFQNLERWECIDFKGTFKECMDYLLDNIHYVFWEG